MKCVLAAAFAAGAAAVTFRGGSEQQSFVLDASMSPKELEDSLLNLMASSRNTPALLKFVDQIEAMIENNMKPPVLQHHRMEQKRLDALPLAFKNCSASLAKEQAQVKVTCDRAAAAEKEQAVATTSLNKRVSDERECLRELKIFTDLQSSTCSLLNSITKESNPCGCTLNAASYGANAAATAQCFTKQLNRFQAADKGCSDAKVKASDKKKVCDSVTAQVKAAKASVEAAISKAENAACSCASAGKMACTISGNCNANASGSFKKTVAAVRIQEMGMKSEWESIQRLQCLAKSISRDDEDRASAIRACRNADIDTSLLDLKYPTEPKPATCTPNSSFKCKVSVR